LINFRRLAHPPLSLLMASRSIASSPPGARVCRGTALRPGSPGTRATNFRRPPRQHKLWVVLHRSSHRARIHDIRLAALEHRQTRAASGTLTIVRFLMYSRYISKARTRASPWLLRDELIGSGADRFCRNPSCRPIHNSRTIQRPTHWRSEQDRKIEERFLKWNARTMSMIRPLVFSRNTRPKRRYVLVPIDILRVTGSIVEFYPAQPKGRALGSSANCSVRDAGCRNGLAKF